ncbi:hypothetical protein ScPMuIL_000930 [Solemya velum]
MEDDIQAFKKKMAASKKKPRGQTSKDTKPLVQFTVYVRVFTDEVFPLKNISTDMKVSDLKKYMEFATGIPKHMQRVSYLDEGDLLDHTDIRSNDIVSGATLQLNVWSMWKELIEAAACNDVEWVFKLGVTQLTDYHTPHSTYMTKKARKAWFDERAFLALYIAAHRGHENLCKKLISSGVDLDACTRLGRTPLHVAASQGRGNIVDLLLERGANIDAEDEDGQTALAIAAKFGHKSCERHLFLFRWQQRAKRTKPSAEAPRMAHQYHDSAFPVWLAGNKCQLYLTNILPPGEYEGTSLGSPPKKHPLIGRDERLIMSAPGHHETYDYTDELFGDENTGKLPMIKEERLRRSKSVGSSLRGGSRGGRAVSYDEWLSNKKDKEQTILNIKKREDERRQLEEDDRKLLEAEKSQSYDMWLAQKDVEKPAGPRKLVQPIENSPAPVQKKGYLRSYLESLKQRRRGNGYEEWLIQKEIEILDKAMEGKPLITC